MNINTNYRPSVEFRKPDDRDKAEISAFKEEFQKHKSGMDGTWGCFRFDWN